MTKSIQDLREQRAALIDKTRGDGEYAGKIAALKEERAKLGKEIHDRIDAREDADWRPEDQTYNTERYGKIEQIDRKMEMYNRDREADFAEIERIDGQIFAMTRQMQAEAGELNAGIKVIDATEIGGGEWLVSPKGMPETWTRHGVNAFTPEQQAVYADQQKRMRTVFGQQATTPGSAGGYLTSVEHSRELLEKLKSFGGMREAAQVMATGTGNQIDWPTVDETGQEGEIIGENTTATQQDITFGTTNIGAYKYSTKIVVVSIELLQDSLIEGPNIVEYVNRALMTRTARITNKHFTTGTGTGQPQGVVTASAEGKVGGTGQTTSVTFDDLTDLEHSVDPAYRAMPAVRWMFHDSTLREIKKLKDTQDRPLWLPGYTVSEPDRVLGYQYTINQDMPVMAANAKSILFGDFDKYLIRDVLAMTLFRFEDSKYMELGQVGFLGWSRHDGKLIDASNEAIKHYVNSAT